jgi:Domain of unknown function (DUF6265)
MTRAIRAALPIVFVAVATTSVAQTPLRVEQVAWLTGCWEAATPRGTVEETWFAPRGATMIASGRTVRDSKFIGSDFVVLREQDGALAYEAHPDGKSGAVFVARRVDDGRVVFENPAHDYPQRVGYERRDADAMLAWIDGTLKGQARRSEFPFRRVKCPGA